MAGQGRGRGLGGQQSAATPADLGAESGDGGNQVLHHQRSETDWRSPCAVGRVRALERGACVPRREKRNRSDPFRRAQLCVVETSFGVVPGSNGLRQFAHDADPGGKIRRSPWSKSAEPWFSPVGNICAAYERRLKPIAWSTCSSTINFETPPPPALGKNAHDGSNVSLRCSVNLTECNNCRSAFRDTPVLEGLNPFIQRLALVLRRLRLLGIRRPGQAE